ncbi:MULTISPECIES: ABC transporter substrate-binding protein [Moorena]|uniref:Bacterial extracellular solute-binding protein n=2 Tax=Moorena TaxID=1155738 RepID=F4XTI6_9CYAN|nr:MULTISPECIES: ABC transporter substrate-binding protein [Moorena]NEQ15482.1 hypothetical protein [Moorena sp. SIO3E2]EGJ32122.1 bacterial extracellular solute-binding protein [Moorena producens 3L]NEP64658.1 hypothetical protein [Moorena sp. SIO3A5]NEQ08402.1 hypothetical protein [Moorena sp. SIO4E2]NER85870.1 hypothetical protein [Moorena sp. SIO3A2]
MTNEESLTASNGNTKGNTKNNTNSNTEENTEWQLAEMVDAIAAEIDRAEDTLSLKSYARGKSMAIKQLQLDIEVKLRRTSDGKILFRTTDPGENSATVIKLDFAQVLESQLQGVRKQLDQPISTRPLATLPGITEAEIKQLNGIGIYSVNDLEGYSQTAAMVAELSRKTGIADSRIRIWRQLPFLSEVKPAKGLPGSQVVIEGGNFGDRDPNAAVFFQGQAVQILEWSKSRLIVTMPEVTGSGVLFVVIDGQSTNLLSWEAITVDLRVRNITITPDQPLAGDLITIEADLINQGNSSSDTFEVQWTVDNKPQPIQSHGPLQPNQRSQDSSIRRQLRLDPGSHTIRFTADPHQKNLDLNRANSTFTREIEVKGLNQLTIADFRDINTLDPLLNINYPSANMNYGPGDVLSLVFRGLGRLDPKTGAFVTDIATRWWWIENKENNTRIIYFQLSEEVSFHDGKQLTVADVEFTYQVYKKLNSSPNKRVINIIRDINVVNDRIISFEVLWPFLKEEERKDDNSDQVDIDKDDTITPIDREQIQSIESIDQIESIEIVDQPRPRPIDIAESPLPRYIASVMTIGIVPRHAYNQKSFQLKPIGSGPFQVERFDSGQEIVLNAFPKYVKGAPRLDRIVISVLGQLDAVTEVVSSNKYNAAVLPYTEKLYSQFNNRKDWTVIPTPLNKPELLHLQSSSLQERLPNDFDTNWNAHLWYFYREIVL